jgi:acetyltransferase-like isoleucine patch superfamily enzyme
MLPHLRDGLKATGRLVALFLVLPALCSYHVRRPFLGKDRAFMGSSQALSLVPGILGQYLRTAFYRCVLARCAASVTIEFGTILSRTGATIDERVYVGPACHLGLVHLERDVLVGAGVHIPSGPGTHGIGDTSRPIRDQPGIPATVRIGVGTWIGSASVVMADVGANSVIAAGAVVTHPVGPLVVAGGVPAAIIRHRASPGVCESST